MCWLSISVQSHIYRDMRMTVQILSRSLFVARINRVFFFAFLRTPIYVLSVLAKPLIFAEKKLESFLLHTHYKINTLQAINNDFLKADKKDIYDFMKIEHLSSSRVPEVPGCGKYVSKLWLEVTKCQRTSGGNYSRRVISF